MPLESSSDGVSKDPLIGAIVAGRYRIISRLGQGGMGVTYRAWDMEASRPVVVKHPKPEMLARPDFIERFRREARMMAALNNPNVVPVTMVGEHNSIPYLVMPFLPGGSLSNRRLRDESGEPKPMHPSTLHLWLPQVAAALDYVHSLGVVHRDVKPGNVFFDAFWHAYLGDFGISKIVEDTAALDKEHTLTATSMAVGTQEYMAPELFAPKPQIDGRVDQYALAVMIYETLAGRRPFTGETAHVIVEVTTRNVPPLSGFRRDLPQSLEQAVYKALGKTTRERFGSCRELAHHILADVPPMHDEPGVARLVCPACENLLKLPTSAGGKQGRCPRCTSQMMVARDLSALWLVGEETGTKPRDSQESTADPGVEQKSWEVLTPGPIPKPTRRPSPNRNLLSRIWANMTPTARMATLAAAIVTLMLAEAVFLYDPRASRFAQEAAAVRLKLKQSQTQNSSLEEANQRLAEANQKFEEMNRGLSETNQKLVQANQTLAAQYNRLVGENNSLREATRAMPAKGDPTKADQPVVNDETPPENGLAPQTAMQADPIDKALAASNTAGMTLAMDSDQDASSPSTESVAVKDTRPIGDNAARSRNRQPGGFGGRIDTKMRQQLIQTGGGNSQSEAAVDSGLKWIVEHQLPDGGWTFNLNACPRCNGKCSHGVDKGIGLDRCGATSMALLPFLGRGYTHKEGPYKKQLAEAFAFLSAITKRGQGKAYDTGGNMYSQGLAGIVLAEVYAMTQDRQLKIPAQAALNYIMLAQDPAGGGWRYSPKQAGDTSAYGWQLIALKSGQLARLEVTPLTVRKAVAFLDQMQGDGGATYGYTDPGSGAGSSGAGTSAIGLLCRMHLGWNKDHPALQRGADRLATTGPSKDLYFDYYATQVLHHLKGDRWVSWNNRMRDMLVNAQSKNAHEAGSWHDDVDGGHGAHAAGRLYCTSLATLILEVYYRHLPLYGKATVDEDFKE